MTIINYFLKIFLVLIILICSSSCNTKNTWQYPDIIDPINYASYFQDLSLLQKDLKRLGYTEPGYGNLLGTTHSTCEKYLVESGYSQTVLLRYKNIDKTEENIVAFEVWITTSGEEKNTERFKLFIEKYISRLKTTFTERVEQKGTGDQYELILGDENGHQATIKNELQTGNQFIIKVEKR